MTKNELDAEDEAKTWSVCAMNAFKPRSIPEARIAAALQKRFKSIQSTCLAKRFPITVVLGAVRVEGLTWLLKRYYLGVASAIVGNEISSFGCASACNRLQILCLFTIHSTNHQIGNDVALERFNSQLAQYLS